MDKYFTDHRFIKALWDDSPVPCAIVSTSGLFTKVNAAWSRVLGYAKAELLGEHFRVITHPADVEDDEAEVARVLSDPHAAGYTMEKRYISRRGAIVWVELYVQVIRDDAGTVLYFAVIVVPRPCIDSREPDNRPSHLSRLVDGYIRVITERTRECLVAFALVLVAFKAVPLDSIVKMVEAYFAR